MAIDMSKWVVVSRPGAFSKNRDSIKQELDKKYGDGHWDHHDGNWTLAWKIGDSFESIAYALTLYREAYYYYFIRHPKVLDWLTRNFSDVYDDNPSNVRSGFDFNLQETDRNHYHDIAIRWAVAQLGRRFEGDKLLQVRNRKPGMFLNPGHIPFHRPEIIEQPELGGWWTPLSDESFYQSNKHILVDKDVVRRIDEPYYGNIL